MEHIEQLVRGRRSVRTFDGRELSSTDLERLSSFIKQIKNPYDIPVEFKLLDGKTRELKCPVANGTDLYVGVKAEAQPHMEEAVGYALELFVLYAQSLGVGTVWVGGTMDRDAFEQAMELGEKEKMPCMSPLGYPAKKQSIKESMMRKAIRADSRNSFESLFFDGSFDTALTPEKAGKLAFPLEMVRWAPSAVNKQPWRVVVDETGAHFYLKRSKGFVSEAVGDMQKIDLGIALCHFELAAKESGLDVRFCLSYPKIAAPGDCEYIASYLL